jgi:hypothetical protein
MANAQGTAAPPTVKGLFIPVCDNARLIVDRPACVRQPT